MKPETPRIINLPRIHDPRGNLTVVQNNEHIPFAIRRAYWIYDVPAGSERGGHSHFDMSQLLVALSGSLNVNLCDGYSWRTFTLNRPFQGLFIPRASGVRSTTFRRAQCACRLSRTITMKPTTSTTSTASRSFRVRTSPFSDRNIPFRSHP